MSEKAFSYLRHALDSNEPFVTGGHGEIQTFGATRHAERMRRIPVWVDDDQKIRELLLTAFPKLQTDAKQKKSAAIWMKVIQLYWRSGMTADQVAHLMDITAKQVGKHVYHISNVAAGKNAHGKDRRKRGRPKLIRGGIQPTSGNDGTDAINPFDN